MTSEERATLPVPTPETMDLWSRQMIEMQQLLLQTAPLTRPAPTASVVDDDDDDLWDNMPV